MRNKSSTFDKIEEAAGNGLIHRRLFLSGGATLLGSMSLLSATPAHTAPLAIPPWMKAPGSHMRSYGQPSVHEQDVQRLVGGTPNVTGSGVSFTPLEKLHGTITPNSLHFERHHSGVPDIDPDQHTLLIHGLVDRPLTFSMDALMRYPTVTRIQFLECSGNSGRSNLLPEAQQGPLGALHGLVSCSEWTGIPLSVLLEEAGVKAAAGWVLAEGADAAAMSRSVPLTKMLDDAIIALYQNGERLRPENGYPMRLFLPGYEGNMSVKWLRRLKVTAMPTMTRDETSHYTDVVVGGKAKILTFPIGVKSIITNPSPTMTLKQPGYYEITGLAWSGAGKIRRVEVSADGGVTWAEAALNDPVLPKSFTRFRLAWRWNGQPAILKSRAIDDTGAMQPTRETFIAEYGERSNYHNNTIQAWAVSGNGEVSNVIA